jgi:nucleoside-diphosphate kinase
MGKMSQKTLIFVKPGHIHLKEKVLEKLDRVGKRILHKEIDKVPKKIIEEHYSEHEGKEFYNKLINGITDKPVVIAIYEGEDIVQKVMDECGPTHPPDAPEGTIRSWSQDTYAKSDSEGRPLENVVHRSDSSESFEKEFTVWREIIEE